MTNKNDRLLKGRTFFLRKLRKKRQFINLKLIQFIKN